MDYPIFLLPADPCFDSLGVIKLRCADSVAVNERIFAQAQLGCTSELLFARVWSFETSPAPDASLRVVLSHAGHTVTLSADAAGNAALLLDEKPIDSTLTAYRIEGEDLQGEYWGVVLMLPLPWLTASLDIPESAPAVLEGNILRLTPALSSAAPEGQAVRFLLG